MITSDRKFGVEIEFIAPSKPALVMLASKINIVSDGSLRPIPYAAEYVSPILSGEKGAGVVQHVCELLKKRGCTSDNIKTSVHVHLDGRNEPPMVEVFKNEPTKEQISISGAVGKSLSKGDIQRLLEYGAQNLKTEVRFVVNRFGTATYLSKIKLTHPPRLNYTTYGPVKTERFEWLQKVFYFYTQYADVMSSIVSNSRRKGNMYCIPLDASYTLEEIEGARNMPELRNIWYKGNEQHTHYDDSRYHAVNLHSFWNRHGTVEIRSHGGTIEPHKILFWVALHQKIVDKLEDISLNDIKYSGNLKEKCKKFIEFVEEPMLQEYVKRLLGFYSGINIK